MSFSVDQIMLLISNAFGTYIIYEMIKIFYDYREYNKRIEIASYVLYFIVASFVQIMFSYILWSRFFFLALFPFLILNYRNFKTRIKKLVPILSILSILFSIEIIQYLGLQILDFANKDIVLLISSKMLTLIVMIMLRRLKYRDRAPVLFFVFVLFIPIGTSYLFSLAIISKHLSSIIIYFTTFVLYVVSILAIRIYQFIVDFYTGALYKDFYIDIFKDILESEDILNYHFQTECKNIHNKFAISTKKIISFLENNELEKALEFCKTKLDISTYLVDSVYSGNKEIDRILDTELADAKKYGIKIDLEVILPKVINEDMVLDFHIILRNLIKNAVTEYIKTKAPFWRIIISMKLYDNEMTLSVSYINDAEGEPFMHYYCSNENLEEEIQIYGYKEIKKIIEKYDTSMTVLHTNLCVAAIIKIPFVDIQSIFREISS